MIFFFFLCSKNKYSSQDLSGLRVEHSMEKFTDGANIVLTLKDKGEARPSLALC